MSKSDSRYPDPCPIVSDEAIIAQFVVELGRDVNCPNCCDPILGHKPTGCLLSAFIYALHDRVGESFTDKEGIERAYTESDLVRTWATVDVDAFWIDAGPMLSRIQDEHYKLDED